MPKLPTEKRKILRSLLKEYDQRMWYLVTYAKDSEILKYDRDNIRVAEILDDCIKSGMIVNFFQVHYQTIIKISRHDNQKIYVDWVDRNAKII